MTPNLTLPHPAQPKRCNRHRQRQPLMFSPAKILRASRHRAQVHAARTHSHSHKGEDHNRKRPSSLTSRRPSTICQCREQISNPKEQSRDKGQRSWIIPVAEIPKQWHRQIHRQLRGRAHCVDLELTISQMLQEQRSVQ